MTLDTDKKTKVEEYINIHEQEKWYWKLAETVADLAWLEKETKENLIHKRLKNNKDLLTYAELHNKIENLNIWESLQLKLLEVKLSVSCPYFEDFKDFLKEINSWPYSPPQNTPILETHENTTHENTTPENITNTPTDTTIEIEKIWNHVFCGTNIDNIQSEPFEKNRKTGVTRCSKTAQSNWLNFWIQLPNWDAYNAWKNPWKDSIQTIPQDKTNKRPTNSRKWISISEFNSTTWNYADIFVSSKSKYWHRASAFKDDSWQWYVLDPYTRVNWILDRKPKKLEDYMEEKKILKANIYHSDWYNENA